MKKIALFLLMMGLVCICFPQQNSFSGKIYDGINFYPIEGANIYNATRKNFVFSDEEGNFSINCQLHDTLIISKSIYRQLIVVLDEELMKKKREDFLFIIRRYC